MAQPLAAGDRVSMGGDRFYSLRRRLFPTARTVLLERDVAQLPLGRFHDILVVGAGDDPYRRHFVGASSYARLDIEIVPGFTDLVADAHQLPLRDACLDCVFASEVLEHLRHPLLFIDESLRVLRPGGQVVLTVPFMFHMHSHPYDFWRPTLESCTSMFGGRAQVAVYGQGNRLHVISDLLTTAGGRWPVLFPLRLFNPLLRLVASGPKSGGSKSTAPTGFCVVATKTGT